VKCPRCDVEMKCDCKACTSRNAALVATFPEYAREGVLQTSEGDSISCGNCGLTAHICEWEDLSYDLYYEERNGRAFL
jgi:hypothetical protein